LLFQVLRWFDHELTGSKDLSKSTTMR